MAPIGRALWLTLRGLLLSLSGSGHDELEKRVRCNSRGRRSATTIGGGSGLRRVVLSAALRASNPRISEREGTPAFAIRTTPSAVGDDRSRQRILHLRQCRDENLEVLPVSRSQPEDHLI